MTRDISRQAAMMTVVASSVLIVLLVIANGLNVEPSKLGSHAIPLALACAAALGLLIVVDERD